MDYDGAEQMEKRNSWEELRASLDADTINPDVVHQEDYYDKLMAAAEKQKRGYNPLKVEAMVSLPPRHGPV